MPQLTPSASCVCAPSRWDLLPPESQPWAVGNVALGSPEDCWLRLPDTSPGAGRLDQQKAVVS